LKINNSEDVTVRKILLSVIIMAMVVVGGAEAQEGRGRTGWGFQKQKHLFEITVFGGQAWTVSKDVRLNDTPGSLDIDTGPFFGFALDANIAVSNQLELLYSRQESDFVFTAPDETPVAIPVAVEYFHLGAVGGIQKRNVMPFSQFTLGATRFSGDSFFEPEWKFSIMFGLGVKYYLTRVLALRLQGRLPFTFIGSDSQFGCGTSGCFTSVGGWGIAQFDLSIGLALLL
jgi:hypothetical protein